MMTNFNVHKFVEPNFIFTNLIISQMDLVDQKDRIWSYIELVKTEFSY